MDYNEFKTILKNENLNNICYTPRTPCSDPAGNALQ